MGAVGGSVWHFVAGLRNSPRGERLLGGTQAVRINAPRLGGSFAVWGGCFASFDCTLVYLRQKEDPWNSIASGFLTGGFLQLRQGPRAALSSAVFGGVLLGFIEGLAIMLNRMTAQLPPPAPPQAAPQMPAPKPQAPPALPSSSPLPSTPLSSLPSPVISDSAVLLPSSDSPSTPSPAPAATSAPPAATSGSGRGWFSWGSSKDTKAPQGPAGQTVGSDTVLVDTAPPPMPDFALKDDSWSKPR